MLKKPKNKEQKFWFFAIKYLANNLLSYYTYIMTIS